MNVVGLFLSLKINLKEKKSNIKIIWKIKTHKMLLCSHSPNDVPPEPQRNVSITAVRGLVRRSKAHKTLIIISYGVLKY